MLQIDVDDHDVCKKYLSFEFEMHIQISMFIFCVIIVFPSIKPIYRSTFFYLYFKIKYTYE